MPKTILYNYAPTAPTQITRENYNAVGGGDNIVGNIRRAFKSDTDFEIWDAAVLGTQLVEGVDYELRDLDNVLTADAGYDVYSAYKILNVAYQACNLYITYKIVMSYNDAATLNNIILKTILTEQGDIIYASAPSTPVVLHHGNAGDILQSGGHAANPSWVDPSGIVDLARQYNYIINPDGEIAQRGASGAALWNSTTTPANNDDTYLWDRTLLISDGNDIVDCSQVSAVLPGSNLCMKLEVETQNKKFGIVKFIHAEDAKKLKGKYMNFSFQAKTEAGKVIENLRCAVLTWAGAADTVTSDVVNAWNAEGADPTWSANWTAENTPANIAITNSWAKYTTFNIYLDSATINNVACVIWADDTDAAVNDLLYLAQLDYYISDGSNIEERSFVPRLINDEINFCENTVIKSYDINIAPGSAGTTTYIYGTALGTFILNDGNIFLSCRMRISPPATAIKTYSYVTGSGTLLSAGGTLRDVTAGADVALLLYGNGSTKHFNIFSFGGFTATRNYGFEYFIDVDL